MIKLSSKYESINSNELYEKAMHEEEAATKLFCPLIKEQCRGIHCAQFIQAVFKEDGCWHDGPDSSTHEIGFFTRPGCSLKLKSLPKEYRRENRFGNHSLSGFKLHYED